MENPSSSLNAAKPLGPWAIFGIVLTCVIVVILVILMATNVIPVSKPCTEKCGDAVCGSGFNCVDKKCVKNSTLKTRFSMFGAKKFNANCAQQSIVAGYATSLRNSVNKIKPPQNSLQR